MRLTYVGVNFFIDRVIFVPYVQAGCFTPGIPQHVGYIVLKTEAIHPGFYLLNTNIFLLYKDTTGNLEYPLPQQVAYTPGSTSIYPQYV